MPQTNTIDINRRQVFVKYTDAEIKDRLIAEALAAEDMTDQHGKPLAGIEAKCHRDGKGFKVSITQDRSAQKLLSGGKS